MEDGTASPPGWEMERWGGGAERVVLLLMGTVRVCVAMAATCWRAAEGVPFGVAVPFVSFGGFVEGRGIICPSSSNLLISKFNRFKCRSICTVH